MFVDLLLLYSFPGKILVILQNCNVIVLLIVESICVVIRTVFIVLHFKCVDCYS